MFVHYSIFCEAEEGVCIKEFLWILNIGVRLIMISLISTSCILQEVNTHYPDKI